ncbi:hypothetical protein [Leuconostoc mesenteroides]|uniref:hypothetical protein n=1 Tax=Leuconostoc mesenteroides TaxID=1245 RepID=UPI00107FA3BE|nr:hypothetical protein [Leuconostoc mesenteroides]MBS0941953.1 hypothetical protein [Leuconostoc mesenteroides]QXC54903.1 hypothetical protein EZV74_09360 [Leuconostoc mesenteroides]TGD35149.1 hypothetical protein EIA53_00170 [Leuconostoc mesenteroides]
MKYSFEQKANTSVTNLWALYADVNKWFTWENDLEEISLDGLFETNTKGSMKLVNMPTMVFELVKVIPEENFTDKTTISNVGEIYFIHELRATNANETSITHSVEFIPSNRKPEINDLQFVSKIFEDVPASIFALIEAATNDSKI